MTGEPGARLAIALGSDRTVSGLLQLPANPIAGYVLAHGAGAGMTHPFMAAIANRLAERRIATLRYQFPYMEAGAKRPDRPTLAHVTVRAAVAEAADRMPGLPLFAGGKSFGARMTSQAQAEAPLPGIRGLVFLGFPLHPANQLSDDRATHLSAIGVPMLFLQGTRDALADTGLLTPLVQRLGATLHLIERADHSFHVPVRSGQTDAGVLADLCDTITAWIGALVRENGPPVAVGPHLSKGPS